MPRAWIETVSDWPSLIPARLYQCRVREVAKQASSKAIRVLLEHLDDEQAGRVSEAVLPLPIRPEGLGASLFRATSVDVAVGAKLSPKDLTGRVVGVRFRACGNGGFEPIAFENIEDSDHDKQPESDAGSARPASTTQSS